MDSNAIEELKKTLQSFTASFICDATYMRNHEADIIRKCAAVCREFAGAQQSQTGGTDTGVIWRSAGAMGCAKAILSVLGPDLSVLLGPDQYGQPAEVGGVEELSKRLHGYLHDLEVQFKNPHLNATFVAAHGDIDAMDRRASGWKAMYVAERDIHCTELRKENAVLEERIERLKGEKCK